MNNYSNQSVRSSVDGQQDMLAQSQSILTDANNTQKVLENAVTQAQLTQNSNSQLIERIQQDKIILQQNIQALQNELNQTRNQLSTVSREKQVLNQHLYQAVNGPNGKREQAQMKDSVQKLTNALALKNREMQQLQFAWADAERQDYELKSKLSQYRNKLNNHQQQTRKLENEVRELKTKIQSMSAQEQMHKNQSALREQVVQQNVVEAVWRNLAKMYVTGKTKHQMRDYIQQIIRDQATQAASMAVKQQMSYTVGMTDPVVSQNIVQEYTLQSMYRFYTAQFSFDEQFMDSGMVVDKTKLNSDPEYFAHAMLHLRKNKHKNPSLFLQMSEMEARTIQMLITDFVPNASLINK
jgi:DNA repair exonuclease SbcCD ATPase subunit